MRLRVAGPVSLAIALWFGLSGGAQASIIIDNFSAAVNDRFANDSSFILDGVDLSGVGINTSGHWVTLVSPNVVIGAYHFRAGVGTTVSFYETNDPSGNSVSRTVASDQRIGVSDVWLAVLDSAVPGYATYDFATEDITSLSEFNNSVYADATASLFGRSPTSTGYGGLVLTDHAVGENVLDIWFDSITVSGTTDDALGAIRDIPTDPNYLTYETFLQNGDSGGPVFVVDAGVPKLVGVNWFIAEVDIDPRAPFEDLRDATGFSYVGNYDVEIQAFIDANPVPEPSTLVLVSAALVLLARRRAHGVASRV